MDGRQVSGSCYGLLCFRACKDFGEMDGLDAGVLPVHGTAEVHEAAVVEGGAVLGVGGNNVLKFGGHHG